VNQFTGLWAAMNNRRRIIVVLATTAMFAAVLLLSKVATAPTMTLLYAGLDSSAAGDVVQSLEQRGTIFSVRGTSIYVDAGQRDELRMTLASEGLPANSGQGYELLDTLSGFGTTSQMFDAAYWRAKEGELARTIVSSSQIKSARVHIANGGSNPFQRNVSPTASVSITSLFGELSPAQVKALQYLVGSAVPGLSPEDVSVIDGSGALIGSKEDSSQVSTADEKAHVLRDRVLRLLEARVGPGNAIVEVDVDLNSESESIRERRFDPETRVAISTDTRESSTSSNDAGGTSVTVASNLPDGNGAAGDNSSAEKSETREQVNYEVSETEREVVRVPGTVKRITVAALVNGTTGINSAGAEEFSPRSEDEMAALRDLITASVGFDEARGDIISLKSMALQPVAPAGTIASVSFIDQFQLDIMAMLQMLFLAIVSLALGLFVVRPILTKAQALPPPIRATLPPVERSEQAIARDRPSAALTGEIADDGQEFPEFSQVDSQSGRAGAPAVQRIANSPSTNSEAVGRLRALIGERQEETVEILRGWLEDREENA
jgi:flagellar M-ring protein FliF